MAEATSSGAVKRVRLDVQSGVVDLRAIEKTISGLVRLKTVSDQAIASLQSLGKVTGIDISSIGKATAQSANQIKSATAAMSSGLKGVQDQAKALNDEIKSIGGATSKTSQGVTAYASGARTRFDTDIIKKDFRTEKNTIKRRLNIQSGFWEEESRNRTVTEDFSKRLRFRNNLIKSFENLSKASAAAEAEDIAKRESNVGKQAAVIAKERKLAEVEDAKATMLANAEADKQKRATAQKQADTNYRKGMQDSRDRIEEAKYERDKVLKGLRKPARGPQEVHSNLTAQIGAQRQFIASLEAENAKLTPLASQRLGMAKLLRKANLELIEAETKLGATAPVRGGLFSFLKGGSFGRGGLEGFQRGLSGWTPAGMLRNAITAGGWMTAVSAFFAVTRTISYSYQRMQELQLQTARLQQVFRGGGDTARLLADDVLKLAAVEGRGTQEAMQAAIAWSRLGLNRDQAARATRASLMAANVAEMSAEESTQRLAAVMASYKLQVSEVDAVLGMLNQSSNTYRVTNKELFEGLSRVSGIASQAGMSLAELQGVLAVTVNQTGQTGANMANALKTVLTRMNRDDVREFFTSRHQMGLTGAADDLRKIWMLYNSVNSEEQRNISLRMGGATQANRFTAIMEGYPEAMKAAVNSLLNLNSAEEENIKITNTAAAASARLVSSWDRLVNRKDADTYASGILNTWAGGIAGMTNIGSAGPNKYKYFDPNQANLLGTIQSLSNTVTLGLGKKIGEGFAWLGGDLWGYPEVERYRKNWNDNLGLFETPQNMEDAWPAFIRPVMQSRARSQAYQTQGNFWKDVAGRWGNLNPQTKSRIIGTLEGSVPQDVISQLQAGNASGLMDAARQKLKEAQDEALRASRLAQMNINLLEQQNKSPGTTDKQRDANTARITELRGEQLTIQRKITEAEDDEISKLERIAQVTAEIKRVSESSSGVLHGFGLTNYFGDIESLKSELRQLELLRKEALGDTDQTSEIKNRVREVQAELNAKASKRNYTLLGMEPIMRGTAQQYYAAQYENYGVGQSQGESLLNKRDTMAAEWRELSSKRNLSWNEQIRLSAIANGLRATEFEIAKRTMEVERERKQVLIDSNKEFQKSLVGAGPSELLRKLAASRMSGLGVTSGAFWAMSPEMRQDVWSLRGGDRMSDLNAEAKSLRGQSLDLSGLQRLNVAAEQIIAQQASTYARAVENAAGAATSLSNLASAAREATAALNNMRPGGATSNTAPSATPPPQASNRGSPGGVYTHAGGGRSGGEPVVSGRPSVATF